MGCDIHVFIECNQTTLEKEWVCVSSFSVLRLYSVFSAIAGVRGDAKYQLSPRGMPNDASQEARKYYESDLTYYHTPTWMHLDEYHNALTQNGIDIAKVNNDFILISSIMSGIESRFGSKTARLVCFFDN